MIDRKIGALVAGTALATTALATTGMPAIAQTLEADQIVALEDWDPDELYTGGLSVERLMDEFEVYGPTGDDIGSVENVLIGADGRVLSIIAQVGGFWDIGDTHVNVPWDQVEIGADERVVIPVTEETVDDYSVFADEVISAIDATGSVEVVDDDVEPVGRVWRATDLIGDYARLRQDTGYANYGYVNDVLIRNGEVAAVIVNPDVGMWREEGVYDGPYAYPYYGYGYGWNPGANYYDLPYARDEVAGMEPFEYDRLGGEL